MRRIALVIATLLAVNSSALAGDRHDDQWFWDYQSTHSPRARQDAARAARSERLEADQQWMSEQAASNERQEMLKELRAIRRKLDQ